MECELLCNPGLDGTYIGFELSEHSFISFLLSLCIFEKEATCNDACRSLQVPRLGVQFVPADTCELGLRHHASSYMTNHLRGFTARLCRSNQQWRGFDRERSHVYNLPRA